MKIKNLMLFLALFIISSKSYSTEYFLVQQLSFEAGKFGDKIYEPSFLLPEDEKYTYSSAVNWNVYLMKYHDIAWFWDNKIEAWATNKQYRTVSWQFENGFSFYKVDIYWYHKSEHFLDDYSGQHFPVNDRVMLRLNFIDKKKGGL